jgi:hypothetical protein
MDFDEMRFEDIGFLLIPYRTDIFVGETKSGELG